MEARTRVAVASLSGAAAALCLTIRELARSETILRGLEQAPDVARATLDFRIACALAISGAAVAALVVTAIAARVRPRLLPMVLLVSAPVAALLGSAPLYSFVDRGLPPEWHVNIPAALRWSPPLAVLVSLVAYGILTSRTLHLPLPGSRRRGRRRTL